MFYRRGTLHAPRGLALIFAALPLLVACASNIPEAIRHAPESTLSAKQVRTGAARYQGVRVRWGGIILGVQNLADETRLEVLGKPLRSDGEPDSDAATDARFLVRIRGFVDPAEYPRDRLLTAVGHVGGIITKPVGEFDYPYPTIQAEAVHLWPEPPPLARYPWYDPWYPYWYPAYRHHPHWW